MTDTATIEVRQPAHMRLQAFQTKHLVKMLRKLQLAKGEAGFDPYRHDQCKSKDGLIKWICDHYTHAEIDAAHDAARQEYKGGFSGRRRRGNGAGSGSSVPKAKSSAESTGTKSDAYAETEAEVEPEADGDGNEGEAKAETEAEVEP